MVRKVEKMLLTSLADECFLSLWKVNILKSKKNFSTGSDSNHLFNDPTNSICQILFGGNIYTCDLNHL